MKRIRWRSQQNQDSVRLLKKPIIIIGANDIGIHLAETLGRESQNVVLIDEKEELLQELNEEMDVLPLIGNPIALQTLKEAGVGEGVRLVAVTESDGVNLLLLFLGQSLGIKEGFALIQNQNYYQSFYSLINKFNHLHLINMWELVTQEIEVKGNLKIRILHSNEKKGSILMATQFFQRHQIIGQKPSQLKIGSRSKVLLVIKSGRFVNTDEVTQIDPGDIVIINIDQSEQERSIRRWFGYDDQTKVMVGGEGLLYALKSHYPNFFKKTVCIEKELSRCQEMLKVIDHALILRGDGLDISLLKEAGIEESQLFIAASENDEINLLSSLIAKSFGVKEVMTILRKRQHSQLLERLKLDGIISIPQLIVDNIQSKIMPGKSSSHLARICVQISNSTLGTGVNLVYRGNLLTLISSTIQTNGEEEVLNLTLR